jgi:hypothetical protein
MGYRLEGMVIGEYLLLEKESQLVFVLMDHNVLVKVRFVQG